MNTRRYPRTLGEAFKDASYACAVERPEPLRYRAVSLALFIGFFAALIAAIWS